MVSNNAGVNFTATISVDADVATNKMIGKASWENQDATFDVTLAVHQYGGLPLQLVFEVWEIPESDDDRGNCPSRDEVDDITAVSSRCRLLAWASVSPGTLVLSEHGRLSLPLLHYTGSSCSSAATAEAPDATGGGKERAKETRKSGKSSRPSAIILRVTPQVGLDWGRRAMTAAAAAKRTLFPTRLPHTPDQGRSPVSPPSVVKQSNDDPAVSVEVKKSADGPRVDDDPRVSVVYMTNAEGSARTWHAPVTPGDSIPRTAYDDVLELTYASLPACCPQARSLVVAPFSDIGVRLGKLWVGPRVASRHAIVTHRPSHQPKGKRGNGKEEALDVIESPREDELFMRIVAAEAEGLLREVRAAAMRVEQRRVALMKVHQICEAWDRTRREAAVKEEVAQRGDKDVESSDAEEVHRIGRGDAGGGNRGHLGGDENEDEDGDGDHASGHAYSDLYRRVLRALEIALPGVSVYLGLLNNGGQTIRYVACTRTSSMAGRELKRGEGISFSCVGPRNLSSVIYPPRQRGLISTDGKNNHKSHGKDRSVASQTTEYGVTHQGLLSSAAPSRTCNRESVASLQGADTNDAMRANFDSEKMKEKLDKRKAPLVERSLEEGAVILQKYFRGKLNRDRLALERQRLSSGTTGTDDNAQRDPAVVGAKKPPIRNMAWSTSSIPKVFDYNGRVGWPFVCVPVEGHLGLSSIGVVGMDTFEQMGNSQSEGAQPEAGVVRMVSEAARYYDEGGGRGARGVYLYHAWP